MNIEENGNGTLVVSGNTDNMAGNASAFRRWINRKAHEHLEPWLQLISEEEGLPFGRTLVRS